MNLNHYAVAMLLLTVYYHFISKEKKLLTDSLQIKSDHLGKESIKKRSSWRVYS